MENKCDDNKFCQLEDFLKQIKNEKGAVLPALQKAQELFGFVPRDAIHLICEVFDKKPAEIYQVATFYAQFNLEEKGRHKLSVCTGTACYVRGAKEVLEKVESSLKIKEGQTTADKCFSLTCARCLGCCALAPVMIVDDQVFGHMTPDKVDEILKNFD